MRIDASRGETALDPLSPKEIQARVRAGASVELVAAETGWPLEKVERYAGPPLAERAYQAERAQLVELRRTGSPVTLAQTAEMAAAADGIAASAIAWDAYRRADGKWVVTATLPAGARHRAASWTYDAAGPNLHPIDEPARWLMGVSDEPIIDFITETPVAVVVEEPRPKLVAVPTIEDDLVDDEVDDDAADEVVADTAGPIEEPADEPYVTSSGQTTIAVPREEPKAKPKPKAKGRRASVPSWDEILFGATRSDD